MPRRPKDRIVALPPLFSSFKPTGIRSRSLPKVILTLDEYEAIRLADHQGYEHSEAAEKMEISRSTFTRLIEKARRKLADFLINGKQLEIEGGYVHFRGNKLRCQNCGEIFVADFVEFTPCPNCGSSDLENLAKNFGHGKCCRRRGR